MTPPLLGDPPATCLCTLEETGEASELSFMGARGHRCGLLLLLSSGVWWRLAF
jgi:hypothetical protein